MRTSCRAPTTCTDTSPRRSSTSIASGAARVVSSSRPTGSATLTTSMAARASSSSDPRRSPTTSPRRVEGDSRPRRRQMPPASWSASASRAPTTSSRRKRAFPPLVDHSICDVPPSTGPPSTSATISVVAAADSPPRSTRMRRSSFHRPVRLSGIGPLSVRSVTTTNTSARSASSPSRADDASSSSCASSTMRRSVEPAAAAAIVSLASRNASARPSAERDPSGRSGANAPNGIVAALLFARTTAEGQPRISAIAIDSVARRVLPTPGGPARTTPATPASMAEASRVSSSSRPASGQVGFMCLRVSQPRRCCG